jgi:hypothetical protein
MSKELAARFSLLLKVFENKPFRELAALFVCDFRLSAVPAVFAYRTESALSASTPFCLAIELGCGRFRLSAFLADFYWRWLHAK